MKAVVLDFGGPVLLTPFERLRALERSLGVPVGTFGWRGPFDPAADPRATRAQASSVAGLTDSKVRPSAAARSSPSITCGISTSALMGSLLLLRRARWPGGPRRSCGRAG